MTLSRQTTADAERRSERASATPSRPAAPRRPIAARPDPTAPLDPAAPLDPTAPLDPAAPLRPNAPFAVVPARSTLESRQQWLTNVITTPEALPLPADAATAERIVKHHANLGAIDRLEIYRAAYHARLIECLADDYSALKYALGAEAFEKLCRDYIETHPSRSFSLNAFGRHMAEFCLARPLPFPELAADLASLEWAIVEAIHAPAGREISVAALASIAPERWPGARLVPNSALTILHLHYPVNAYLQGYLTGGAPSLPARAEAAVAVYRTGRTVWRLDLAPPTAALFEALAGGATLAEAIERTEPLLAAIDEAHAAEQVKTWFHDGIASGIFCGVITET